MKPHRLLSTIQGRIHWLSILHASLCKKNKSWGIADMTNLEGYLKGRFNVPRDRSLVVVSVQQLHDAAMDEKKKVGSKMQAQTEKAITSKINSLLHKQQEYSTMAKKKVTKKAGAKKTSTKKVVAGSDLMDMKITVKSKENPKRASAAVRFNIYKNDMKVSEYIMKGGDIRDVRWDVKKGFITIKK